MNIRPGEKFPSFSGRTFDGRYFDLDTLAGKNVVLYFYPKDDTPGCTCEAKEFSQLLGEFTKANTEVLGVSVDTLEAHEKFSNRHKLKVPLISDSDRQLVEKIGIKKPSGSALRVTFILDGEGKVRKIYEKVNPEGHAKEVLGYIKSTMQPAKSASKTAKRIKESSAPSSAAKLPKKQRAK